MFWGLIVEPNKKYAQKVTTPFHISQAVLDVNNTKGDPDVQLILSMPNSDVIDKDHILCVLKKSGTRQVPLNLIFSEGDDFSFHSVNGTIHLSGYLVDERNFRESSDEDETLDFIDTEKRRMAQVSSDSDNEGGSENDASDDEEDAEGEGRSDNEESKVDNDSEEEQPIPTPVKRRKLNGTSNINGPKKAQKPIGKENKIRRLDGDVTVQDIRKGTGPIVKSGTKVGINFECFLQSNKKSVQKYKTPQGHQFTVGKGEVVRGWDIGIVGMKAGGKRKITCSPGPKDKPPGIPQGIPPNATLVYQIELVNVL